MHASIPASRVVPDDESRLGDTTFIAFQRFAAVRMHLVSEGAARGVSHGTRGPASASELRESDVFVRDESLPRHRVSLTSRRDCLCVQPKATAAMKVCAVRARCRHAKGSLSLQVQLGTLHGLIVGFAASLSP